MHTVHVRRDNDPSQRVVKPDRQLLELVAQGERSVEALAERSGLSIANASQHLQHLRRAGPIKAQRQAKFVLYRLADDAVLAMLAAMQKVAERNIGEVERILRSYFHARDDLEPVSRTELSRRMKHGLVTVLDMRPGDEFALGHLPGARNIPLTQLKRHLSKLDRKTEIIAYCRGPYCVLSSRPWPSCANSELAECKMDCRSGRPFPCALQCRRCLSRARPRARPPRWHTFPAAHWL